jgi:hypothetical protein
MSIIIKHTTTLHCTTGVDTAVRWSGHTGYRTYESAAVAVQVKTPVQSEALVPVSVHQQD